MIAKRVFNEVFGDNTRPPVWMMRQAGRYQLSYQKIRQKYSFENICLTPQIATQIAINAVEEFDFDAAILFSDILFLLETMGPKLCFNPAPKFSYLLRDLSDLKKYHPPLDIDDRMGFQAEALYLTRKQLPNDKALIGFVGGPLTIYNFAVEGSGKGSMDTAKKGFTTGLFEGFMEKLIPLLNQNLRLQAKTQPDAIAIFDSGLSYLSPSIFIEKYAKWLLPLLKNFKTDFPDIALIYYAKTTYSQIFNTIAPLVDVVGVCADFNLQEAFKLMPNIVIQGNFNETFLTEPPLIFNEKLDLFLKEIQKLPLAFQKKWIASLGHGLLPNTNPANVREFVRQIKKFSFY